VSVAGAIKPVAAGGGIPRWRWVLANARGGLALLVRAPRAPARASAWREPLRLASVTLIALAAIAGSMFWLDAPTIVAVQSVPAWLNGLFNQLTDYGTSGWLLVPIGIALLALAALASPSLSHASRLVVTALAVRLGFVFAAVALPGLFVTIVKRLIGRARPFVGGHADPFLYRPFGWEPDYASLPSGHATNVFAALIAIGLVWPRLRGIMLVYALVIAASRIVVLAHHPSDVLAGALAGAVGALLVRDWFAARRLGFAIGADGEVRALPGPSWRRLKQVARRFGPALRSSRQL
jgi:membrane-associated phospholipid phosphatase